MKGKAIITEKMLIKGARLVSALFTPFSIPLISFGVLFTFSYLRIMPMQYKLVVAQMVFFFTILTPTLTIYLFQRMNKLSPEEMAERKRRFAPFLLTIISYLFCFYWMKRVHIPWYMTGIILAALLMLVICVIVNLKWKLSEHMAGAGAVIGGLVAFSALFGYNPLAWLCVFILIAGLLGSARITLNHHTLGEVIGGLLVGLGCSLLVLHPYTNLLFRIFLL